MASGAPGQSRRRRVLSPLMSARVRAAAGSLGITVIDPHMVRRSDDMATCQPETTHGHLSPRRPGRRSDGGEALPTYPSGKR
jgi:hypothetical protein